MKRDPRAPLADVELAVAKIERFTPGIDLAAYLDDDRTQNAVERNFEIIGEAPNRLHRSSPGLADRIPRLRKIVDFRNRLIRGYRDVDAKAVWDAVVDRLPEPHSTVQAPLAEPESAASDRDTGGPFDLPDPFEPPSPFDRPDFDRPMSGIDTPSAMRLLAQRFYRRPA